MEDLLTAKDRKQAIGDNQTQKIIPMNYKDARKAIANAIKLEGAQQGFAVDQADYMEAGYHKAVIHGLQISERILGRLRAEDGLETTPATKTS